MVNMEIDGDSVFHESDVILLLDFNKVSFLHKNCSIDLVFFSIAWAIV